ncbi:MAG: DUF4340 domain-containing protein [Hyphomicrobiaceae bacterium]
MEPKHFTLLAAAAAISLVTAGIVHSAYDTWSTETVRGEKLFPSFVSDAGQIGKVALAKGKDRFTFEKEKDGVWLLSERGNYPAKADKIRELLLKVATAELVESKTRDPKRYDLLDLGDPDKEGASATLLQFTDDDGKSVGELVVGKQRSGAFGSGKSGTYVRRPGEDETWLTNVAISAPLNVTDWVEAVFFKMDLGKFKSLTLDPPDGDPVVIAVEEKVSKEDKAETKEAGGAKKAAVDKTATTEKSNEAPPSFKFAAVPDGKQVKPGVDAAVMIKALESLEMTDLRTRKDAKVPSDAVKIPAVLETTDGLKLRFTVTKVGENDRWVAVDVEEDGNAADVAKKFRKDLDAWEFKIPDWRSRQVFKSAAEMFEDKPKPPPTTESKSGVNSGAGGSNANPVPNGSKAN